MGRPSYSRIRDNRSVYCIRLTIPGGEMFESCSTSPGMVAAAGQKDISSLSAPTGTRTTAEPQADTLVAATVDHDL